MDLSRTTNRTLPKAYWIADVPATDPERYWCCMQLAPAAFQKRGARFQARRRASETCEGQDFVRHIVIEFPSLNVARARFARAEYTAAHPARDGACAAHVSIVEALPKS